MSSDDLKDRILRVKLLLLDVDGVLTDGRIVYGDYGDELKFFDVQDGFGLMMLRRAGIPSVIISAKKSGVNHRRAKELQVAKIYQNVRDKLRIFEKVVKKMKLKHEEVCYMGDDLVDIPVLLRVGFAVGVHNAVDDVKESVHYVTIKNGGRGAVREVIDLILKTQHKWPVVTEGYFQ
ncbi:MAG: hypothetical protein AUJ71_00650 [Candidatus Omnitrophica bacterium CG1_02_49_16]|nr:MAG: hypothetical protein AUJ71_00650 [Candidatus Omnitrophica bacterium CG1_02_49_16]